MFDQIKIVLVQSRSLNRIRIATCSLVVLVACDTARLGDLLLAIACPSRESFHRGRHFPLGSQICSLFSSPLLSALFPVGEFLPAVIRFFCSFRSIYLLIRGSRRISCPDGLRSSREGVVEADLHRTLRHGGRLRRFGVYHPLLGGHAQGVHGKEVPRPAERCADLSRSVHPQVSFYIFFVFNPYFILSSFSIPKSLPVDLIYLSTLPAIF